MTCQFIGLIFSGLFKIGRRSFTFKGQLTAQNVPATVRSNLQQLTIEVASPSWSSQVTGRHTHLALIQEVSSFPDRFQVESLRAYDEFPVGSHLISDAKNPQK